MNCENLYFYPHLSDPQPLPEDYPSWVPAMMELDNKSEKIMETKEQIFNPETHVRAFAELPWEPMHDEYGNVLDGIRGKTGATEIGSDGEEIGADMIEMMPGSAFPLHTHPGDHLLYAISGKGTVTIDGEKRHFESGMTFYIAAKYPHNVATYADAAEPFVILAVGHPKKHVSALDRMKIVEE